VLAWRGSHSLLVLCIAVADIASLVIMNKSID
jgi:hypothetical protein